MAKPAFNERLHPRGLDGRFVRSLPDDPGIVLRGDNSGSPIEVTNRGMSRGSVLPTPSGRYRTTSTGDREFPTVDSAAQIAAYTRPPTRGSQRQVKPSPDAYQSGKIDGMEKPEAEITNDARATIGRAKTVHRATAEVIRDDEGMVVKRQILATACGTDRYRGGRSTFSSAPQRWAVDCERCLSQH